MFPLGIYLRMILCTYDSFYNLTVAGTLTTSFFPLPSVRTEVNYCINAVAMCNSGGGDLVGSYIRQTWCFLSPSARDVRV